MNRTFESFKDLFEGETEVYIDIKEQKANIKSNSPIVNFCIGVGLVLSAAVAVKIAVK